MIGKFHGLEDCWCDWSSLSSSGGTNVHTGEALTPPVVSKAVEEPMF